MSMDYHIETQAAEGHFVLLKDHGQIPQIILELLNMMHV